jgi:4-hydroxy-tetrahydrodipicolinate synthase
MRTGAFTALITPFHADGDVDHSALAAHVERVVAAGQDGILVCGSTSEFPALDESERLAILETCSAAAAGRVAVAVHVGTSSTRASIRLARHAVTVGADTIAAVTPYYLGTDGAGLTGFLEDLHAVAPGLPLLAYSIGKLTGYEYPVAVLADLAARGVIAGVKESGEDLGRLLDIHGACGAGFNVFAGSPNLQAAAFSHGLAGTMLGLSNVVPEECARVARLAESGDHAGAAALTVALRPLSLALSVGTPMAALKYAMHLRFGTSPAVRAPRHELAPAERGAIEEAVAGLAL